MTLNELRARLDNVKGEATQFTARCPAHDDRANSLSVGMSDDGERLLLHCHAGCTTEGIVDALGMKMADLFVTKQAPPNRPAAQRTYSYHDADGTLLYTKTRIDKPDGTKDFQFKRPNGEYGVKDIKRVPYNLPSVIAAQTAYFVEGEKCADAVIKAGRTATTLDGGANSKWLPEYGGYFDGKTVIIIPDNDEDGKPSAIRALAPSKTNLVAGDPPCILFELSQENGFLWAGIDNELTAERLYDPLKTSSRDAPERDGCVEFLKELLSGGALPSSDIWEATEANGYSEITVNRAKKRLNIRSIKEKGKGGVWMWELQGYHTKTDDKHDKHDNLTDKGYQGYHVYHVNKGDSLTDSLTDTLTENNIFRGRI